MDVSSMLSQPVMRVKLVTLAHFGLLCFAMQDHWIPPAYLFYNSIYILCLLWSIHAPLSADAVHFAALINFASFIFDLLCIIKNFPSVGGVWSLVFAILNLVLRPFSLLLLNRELVDRGGNFLPTTTVARQNYEDIENPNASTTTEVNVSNMFK